MSLLKKGKEEITKQYYEILLKSYHDETTLLKIQNLTRYIEARHKDALDTQMIKQAGFLPTIAYYYKYDRDLYISKLKYAKEEEIEKLVETISSYDLFLAEIGQLIEEEQAIVSRQIKKRRLEKFLTKEEIALIEKECQSRLMSNSQKDYEFKNNLVK